MADIFDKIAKNADVFDEIQYTPTKEFKKESLGPDWQPRPSVEVARDILPIALDIVGSVVAPELAIPHGIGTVATIGRKMANVASRMAGSAAGGGVGEYLGQFISGEKLDPAEAGKQAALGAAGELGGTAMGVVGKGLAKPLFPLFSKITLSGQIGNKMLSNKLIEKTVGRANNFLYDIAPDMVKKQTVDFDDIALKLAKGKEEIGKIYDAYKEPLKKKSKEGKFLTINTEEYFKFLKQKYTTQYPKLTDKQVTMRLLAEEFGYAPGGLYGRQLKRIIDTGESPNSDDFFWLLDHVFREKPKSGGSFLKVTPTQQTNRRALKKAYLMDMDEVAGEAKGAADKLYMEYRDFLDIKKIFDKSIKEADLGMQSIDPYKLSKNIYMNKDAVLKIDTKRTAAGLEPYWPKLEGEAKFYADIVPYFKKATQNVGIRPGMMGTAGSVAGAISSGASPFAAGAGAYAMFGPVGIPIVEGFGAISAYSLLSPTGKKAVQLVARHATKGGLKAGLHIGGQLVDFRQEIGFSK